MPRRTSAPILALVGFVGLCLLTGMVAGGITTPALRWYAALTRPPLTPPAWLFGPVWSVLYLLMGGGAWLVWRRRGLRPPLSLWGWQLLLNGCWAPAFFGLHSPRAGLVVIVAVLLSTWLCAVSFWRVRPAAGLLIAPTAVWVTFATYLNAGFVWLNAGF